MFLNTIFLETKGLYILLNEIYLNKNPSASFRRFIEVPKKTQLLVLAPIAIDCLKPEY